MIFHFSSLDVFPPYFVTLEVPIETVSKILGHADIKTTQIYAKVIDKSKRSAVDKLDELTE